MSSPGASGAIPSTNPFLAAAAPAASSAPIVDLFDAPVHETRAAPNSSTKASDDLLQLGNPFADMFGNGPAAAAAPAPTVPPMTQQMWMGNGAGELKVGRDSQRLRGLNGIRKHLIIKSSLRLLLILDLRQGQWCD